MKANVPEKKKYLHSLMNTTGKPGLNALQPIDFGV